MVFLHCDLIGHLKDELFLAHKAAEYSEVYMLMFRRYVKSRKVIPAEVFGGGQLFFRDDLIRTLRIDYKCSNKISKSYVENYSC